MGKGCSEAELLLLNHIVYRKELFQLVNEEYAYVGYSIRRLFDEECLLVTRQQAMDEGEWKEIYRLIKEDEKLLEVMIKALYYDVDTGAQMAKLYAKDEAEYIFVFAGTGMDEWRDNAVAGNQADSLQQVKALNWYQSQIQNDQGIITVTGHSKGGNKAMYIAVINDTVTRCVAFDGEGFSKQFLQKYETQIKKNAKKIHLRANTRDYINVLLYQIEGSDILYIENKAGVDGIEEYHCPNALFAYDNNNVITAKLGPTQTKNDPVMEFLHNYLAFLLEHAPEGEKTVLLSCVGEILTAIFSGDSAKKRNEIKDQFKKTAGVIALKYLQDLLEEYRKNNPDLLYELRDALTIMMVEHYKTGKETLVYLLFMTLYSNVGSEEALDSLLYVGGTRAANIMFHTRQTTIRDFSKGTVDTIIKAAKEQEREPWWNIFRWDCWYRIEDLLGHLNLNNYAVNEPEYFRKKIDMNNGTANEIQKMIDHVHQIDQSYQTKLQLQISELDGMKERIDTLLH